MPLPCDLHLHSTASDGSVPPDQLARDLGEVHLAVLTDHDTLAGNEAFNGALVSELTPPQGVELSLRTETGSFHLLVYGYALAHSELADRIAEVARARADRNFELLERANQIGLVITADEVLQVASAKDFLSKSVGRPHFAQVMVDRGYVATIQEAFDRYLAKGRPLYSPKALFRFDEIGPLAADLGFATVVAHPLSLGLPAQSLTVKLREYRSLGLTGLECLYAAYNPAQRAELTEIAQSLGLLVTGGSDFHGTFKPGLESLRGYGDLLVPADIGSRLIEQLTSA